MKDEVRRVGGAMIGLLNATWPLATLYATSERISLSVLGSRYTFTKEEVTSIQKHTIIPLFGWGIRIHHILPEYPNRIVFWCFGSPGALIEAIEGAGFIPAGKPNDELARRGIPVRWETILAGIILWNALFMTDIAARKGTGLGPFSFAALVLVFLVTTNLWWCRPLQRIVLKPGRSYREIRHWLFLLSLLSGVLAVGVGISFFALRSL